MITLKSKTVSASFDNQGRLVKFINTSCTPENIIIAPPKSAFRMTCRIYRGCLWSRVV